MKWKIVALLVFVIGIAGAVWAYQEKRLSEKIKQITQEQSQVRVDLQNEISSLNEERQKFEGEIRTLKSKQASLMRERDAMKVKLDEIENRLAHIPVPQSMGELSEKFKSRGFNPVLRP